MSAGADCWSYWCLDMQIEASQLQIIYTRRHGYLAWRHTYLRSTVQALMRPPSWTHGALRLCRISCGCWVMRCALASWTPPNLACSCRLGWRALLLGKNEHVSPCSLSSKVKVACSFLNRKFLPRCSKCMCRATPLRTSCRLFKTWLTESGLLQAVPRTRRRSLKITS